MFIKRFVVNALPQVMSVVRDELGPDAIILSSRKIRRQGIAGFFGLTAYEVFAAIEDKVQEKEPRQDEETILVPEDLVIPTQSRHAYQQGSTFAEVMDEVLLEEQEQIEVPAPVQSEPDSIQTSAVNGQLIEEIKSIKTLLNSLLFDEFSQTLALEATWQNILIQWSKSGLSTEILHRFIETYHQKKNADEEILYPDFFYQFLRSLVREQHEPRTIAKEDRLILLVGPTGVGKTTTIAKLAATAKLHEGRNVGLITIDTFRVAAKEQLQTYADILNVPLRIAHNAQEIQEHIEALHDCDLIFVDTMGRNFLDSQQAAELAAMLDGVAFDVRYLVVSFSSRLMEALETAEVLNIVGYDAVLLTKNDEAKLPALLFSLVDQLHKPLSYITIGQEVPNDLMVAHVDAIMELFAGGDHDGRSSGDVAADHPREDAKTAVN